MGKILVFLKYSFLFFIVLVLISFSLVGLYDKVFGFHIVARFSELGPLTKHMPVFYRGYKIGKTTHISPDKSYQYTHIDIILYAKKLVLPKNTIAKVKKLGDGKSYIDLVYPENPQKEVLLQGAYIEGKTAVDIESFMSAQADSGALTNVTNNIQSALKTLESTGKDVDYFFTLMTDILSENSGSIKASVDNTKSTTQSLKNLSAKLDRTIEEIKLKNMVNKTDNSLYNLQMATQNVVLITQDIEQATKDLDKTLGNIDKAVNDTKVITANVKCITVGIKQALAKKFAGMRIIFGTPIN